MITQIKKDKPKEYLIITTFPDGEVEYSLQTFKEYIEEKERLTKIYNNQIDIKKYPSNLYYSFSVPIGYKKGDKL